MLVGAHQFHPFAAVVFRHDSARDDDTGNRALWRVRHDIGGEDLLFAGFGEVAEEQDFGLATQEGFRGGLIGFGNGWFRRLGVSLDSRL